MPLEPADRRHLVAAEGYLELGMALEANEELEHIEPDVRHVAEVLALRLQVYQQLGKWELMQVPGTDQGCVRPAIWRGGDRFYAGATTSHSDRAFPASAPIKDNAPSAVLVAQIAMPD